MDTSLLEKNKAVVKAMYEEFFNGHDIKSALKYVKKDYIQHNPGPGQGRDNLMLVFGEKFKSNPGFHLDIQFMIAEGNMVAVYLKSVTPAGKTACRVVDIYRLENGLLAEHWDVLQSTERSSSWQKKKKHYRGFYFRRGTRRWPP